MAQKSILLNSGLNICFTEQGDPANETILLLHGWPASRQLWRNIIPDLAKHFHVIAPDLPGYGDSDKHLDAAIDLSFLKQFILEFTQKAELEEFHLVAHDLGGTAALSFAAQYPDRIDKFVIMNTSPYIDVSLRLRFSLFLLKQPWLSSLLLTPFVFKQVLKTGIYNQKCIDNDLLTVFRTPWIQNPQSRQAFSKTIDEPLSKFIEPIDNLRSIQIPTLILWGKKDIFFPFSIACRLHQDLKNSTLVGIENAAHFCQEEEPEFIARMILKFIQGKAL